MTDNIEFERTRELSQRAAELINQLGKRFVLAESCTAGLISAVLAQNSGISKYHCGSAVTYREASKVAWLGVDRNVITEHTAVSAEVTELMASCVLTKTPEAAFSLAITGHLEAEATEGEPIVFVAIQKVTQNEDATDRAAEHLLEGPDRICRQWEAVRFALERLCSFLQGELESK